jgi:adenylate cyclase
MAREPAQVRARTTVRGVVLRQLLANGLGLATVLMYFRFLFPQGADELRDRSLNAVVFGSYVLFMVLIALPVNAGLLHRAVSWVREERTPTAKERRQLFNLPLVETLSAFVSWLFAAVLFGWLNQDIQRISVGIALAGVVTCTLLYLVLEGHFRPLYALALRDAALPQDRRDVLPRLMFAWVLGSGIPLFAIAVSNMITPEPLDSTRLMWVALTALIAGCVVMWLAARSVERPILTIRDGLRKVEQGELDLELPVDDLGELGRLTEGVNNLAAGLREREELRDLFHAQVGQAGLADMVKAGVGPTSLGEQREVTVLFVDLRGYTRYAESHTPAEVVAMLNRFFRCVVAAVNREGGWVNKFEGDAALCIFGAPQDQPDHAVRALRAARALPRQLEHTGGPLRAGIGLASGEVLAGFVGTPERYEYTVIGDVVNLAARLCDEAKRLPSGVLASESTILDAGTNDGWKPSGRLRIRGRREPANVFTPASDYDRRVRWPSVNWLGR